MCLLRYGEKSYQLREYLEIRGYPLYKQRVCQVSGLGKPPLRRHKRVFVSTVHHPPFIPFPWIDTYPQCPQSSVLILVLPWMFLQHSLHSSPFTLRNARDSWSMSVNNVIIKSITTPQQFTPCLHRDKELMLLMWTHSTQFVKMMAVNVPRSVKYYSKYED